MWASGGWRRAEATRDVRWQAAALAILGERIELVEGSRYQVLETAMLAPNEVLPLVHVKAAVSTDARLGR
jgi:hypothetical protein